jgi:hypothetical protein
VVNRALLSVLLALPLGCRGTFDLGQYASDGGSTDTNNAETMDGSATGDASETRFETGTDTDTNTDTNTETDTDTDTTDTDMGCSVGTTDIGTACIGVIQILDGTNPPTDIEVADFSGDDLPDLLIAGLQAVSYHGGLGGEFGVSIPIIGAAGPRLASVDWNNDGRLDFAPINDEQFQLFLSAGDGIFTPGLTTTLGGYDAVFGDFNQDNLIDAFLSGPTVQGFLNTNGVLMQAYDVGDSSEGIAAGDLDDDGDLDIVFAMPTMDQIGGLLTMSDWNFSILSKASLSLANDLAVADVDGIPGDEVIAVGGDPGQLFVGKLEGGAITQVGIFPVGTLPRAIALGDIDGDGTIDAAVGNASSHDVSVVVGVGGPMINEVRLPIYDPIDNPESIAVADLDGDDQAEIIVGMISSDRVIVYGAM